MLLIVAAAHAIGGEPARDPGPDSVRTRFRAWRRGRPIVGGLLTALGGVELVFSGQLDIGKIHVQLGIEGLQATIIPILLVLLGILVIAMPAHRIFYGVIALAVAVYSLVGVNLGGFFVGMLLSTVGRILTVAWMPKKAPADADEYADADAAADADVDADVDAHAGVDVDMDADADMDASGASPAARADGTVA
jgi:hypothetical protein